MPATLFRAERVIIRADWPARFEVSDIELTLRAAHCLAQDLESGVTTARCLGDQTGAPEAGRSADFIAVAGDPLADPAALGRVRAVVARGELVHWSE
jgi:imidazolonepropionase-like amidohydrolase